MSLFFEVELVEIVSKRRSGPKARMGSLGRTVSQMDGWKAPWCQGRGQRGGTGKINFLGMGGAALKCLAAFFAPGGRNEQTGKPLTKREKRGTGLFPDVVARKCRVNGRRCCRRQKQDQRKQDGWLQMRACERVVFGV